MIQEPIVVIDYVGQIADGAVLATDGMPVIGMALFYGMIYSTQEVTLSFQQGVSDVAGVFAFRHTKEVVVPAGTAIAKEYPVHGKYCRVVITNASGFDADIEAFFCARSHE